MITSALGGLVEFENLCFLQENQQEMIANESKLKLLTEARMIQNREDLVFFKKKDGSQGGF